MGLLAPEKAGIAVVLSHHKASGLPNHGKVVKTLARIEEAARQQLGLSDEALVIGAAYYAAPSVVPFQPAP